MSDSDTHVEDIMTALRVQGVTYSWVGSNLKPTPPLSQLPADLAAAIRENAPALKAHLLSRPGGELCQQADRLWALERAGQTDTRAYRDGLNRYLDRLLLYERFDRESREVGA